MPTITTTITKPHHPTITELPTEVLEIILSNLERHQIAACVLVSQEWSNVFNPHLWKSIHFNNRHLQQPQHWTVRNVFDESDPESRFLVGLRRGIESGALVRNGRWIQNIDCRDYEVARLLAKYGESCSNLLDLRIGVSFNTLIHSSSNAEGAGEVGVGDPNVDLSALITILERNPGLRKLRLEREMLDERNPDLMRLIDVIPASVECLEFEHWDPIYRSRRFRFEQEKDDEDDGDQGHENESGQHAQRQVIIDNKGGLDIHRDASRATLASTTALLSNLKRLSFKNYALDHQKQTLHQLLGRCHNLETIQLDVNHKVMPLKVFSSLLQQHCPKLQHLFIMHDWHYFSDEEMRDILDASTAGWRSLGLPQQQYESHEFGSLSIPALLRHAGTLENLRLDGSCLLPSSTVQQLLTSAPNLKRFDAIRRDRSLETDFELNAGDIVTGEPWICTELQSFKARIVGVTRPDVTKRANGRPLEGRLHQGTVEESHRIQRGVYEQLGRLIGLKQLILGHDDVDYTRACRHYEKLAEGKYYNEGDVIQKGYQYECLEMTVESGMGAMAGLKELRILELEAMEVGKMDQEWAKMNWPKLGSRYKDTFWTDLGYREYS
ncbi:hypothetical protein BGZ95_000346 [Linnemannia exigua]|uniref:F-box domain-containing protein n=1 Tax=Linnemannia exigua TaxID=604196 RepID=A0AAD4DJF7_9FUNG|nr:hypothetical protein BGZ95_000346 [Linnemannia exigua]